VAVDAEVGAGSAGTRAAALATPSAVSAAGDTTCGTTLGVVSAVDPTGKVPRELFRTLGFAGRCGAWAQAANASSIGTRSE